ncbi:unnamed protein product [Closterium sp. Naga37s-1]|nr:unnamed protein product [Closterium sp. Naga37s-1]
MLQLQAFSAQPVQVTGNSQQLRLRVLCFSRAVLPTCTPPSGILSTTQSRGSGFSTASASRAVFLTCTARILTTPRSPAPSALGASPPSALCISTPASPGPPSADPGAAQHRLAARDGGAEAGTGKENDRQRRRAAILSDGCGERAGKRGSGAGLCVTDAGVRGKGEEVAEGGDASVAADGLTYPFAAMFTARRKIQKEKGQEPDEFEETVAQALFDLEATNQELKSDLRDLFINSAKEIDVSSSRKAVIVHVPYRLRKAFQKIHARLVRELEKKFSGKDVVLVATRRILPKPRKGSKVVRPRTRTLTAVHEAILEDLVFPTEIVGKRVRFRLDGSRIMKVYLDPKERNSTEYKVETFSAAYKKLTGKDVVFEFPITEAAA